MKETARVRANRRNAKRSTGPRTAAGKARVARNALKHGLAVPVMETSGAEPRIEEMARVIAGEGADPGRLEQGRRVAEAQLDLIRINEVRRLLYENTELRRKKHNTREKLKENMNILRWCEIILETPDHRLDQDKAAIEASENLQRVISEREASPPSLEEGIGNLVPQLHALDRYEQRARSRRKVAIRAFDAYWPVQGQVREGEAFGSDNSRKKRNAVKNSE